MFLELWVRFCWAEKKDKERRERNLEPVGLRVSRRRRNNRLNRKMSLTSVKMSEEVWLSCLTHALSTETEEVMGLLFGDIQVI